MTRTHHCRFLAGIISLAAWAATATTQPIVLTSDEAVAYALKHSRTLAQAQIGVEQADNYIALAESYYYPNVALSGSFGYLSNVSVLKMPVAPGVYSYIPLGAHANYDARLSLTQTLYSGGRLTKSYAMAQKGKEIAQLNLARSRQQLIYNVRSAYDNVVLLKQLLQLTQRSQALARNHLAVVDSLFASGFVSSYDRLRTSVQVDNLSPQIANLEKGIALALEGLKLTIGMPLETELKVSDTLLQPEPLPDTSFAHDQALDNRADLKVINDVIRLLELSRGVTAASYQPTIGASAAYDLKNPVGIGTSSWGTNLTVGLGINYTLFDGMRTRIQLRQMDDSLRQVRITRELLKDAIALQVKEALLSLKAAEANLNFARANVAVAEQGVKLSEARYRAGQGSNLEVLDSQLALHQSQVNVLQATKDYNDACNRLLLAIGKENL